MDTMKQTRKITHLVSGSTATGCGAWGSGTSQAKALASFRRSGGDVSRAMYLYEFGPETTYLGVGGTGYMAFHGPAPVGRPFAAE